MTDAPPDADAPSPKASRWSRTRVLQWIVLGLLCTGVLAFLVKGANGPADPSLARGDRRPVAGFGEIAYRINKTNQQTRCALLAQTDRQRQQGLMGRDDLSGYDGMLFAFPADTTETFWMKDTPLPLSIAWFDEAGRFVSSTDMEPCLNRPDAQCPLYAATGPYRYALELERGQLDAQGIGPGSLISVGGPCA